MSKENPAATGTVRRLRETAAAAVQRGDTRAAIDAYRAALELEAAPDPAEYDRLGTLLHAAGARTEAVACFRKSAALEGKERPPARAQIGSDPRTLVIGFTGFHGMIGVSRMNFLEAAGLQDYSLLALWDSSYRFFLGGLPGLAEGYDRMVDLLRTRIPRFSAQKVIVVGCSGSGFPALLYGHAIGADVVHAFAPGVSLDLPIVEQLSPPAAAQYREVMVELAQAGIDRRVLHLPSMLASDNRKTRYYVHHGRDNRDDSARARFISSLPGVQLIEHATASHHLAELLAKANLLKAVFTAEKASEIPRLS